MSRKWVIKRRKNWNSVDVFCSYQKMELSSLKILVVLNGILREQPEIVFKLWNWGYDYYQKRLERHRWREGTLYGFWLTEQKFHIIKKDFDNFLSIIEGLSWVKEVSVDNYKEHALKSVGEKWKVHFMYPVIYTHRKRS